MIWNFWKLLYRGENCWMERRKLESFAGIIYLDAEKQEVIVFENRCG